MFDPNPLATQFYLDDIEKSAKTAIRSHSPKPESRKYSLVAVSLAGTVIVSIALTVAPWF